MYKKSLSSRIALILLYWFITFRADAQIANTLSPAEKVFGLSRIWQEVNYNFVYLNKIGRSSWDSAYKVLIPQAEATKNDYDYYRLLQKFCALLKDGHTEIIMPPIAGVQFMNNTFGDNLIVSKRIAGKVIIKRTWKKDIGKFPLGSEIVEVNGLPADQYINDSIAPYICSSTDYVLKDFASATLLRGVPGSTFRIKIKKPDGEEATYSLTHARVTDSIFSPPGEYLDEQKRDLLEYRQFDKGLAYVALNSFADAKIDTLFEALLPALQKANGIIIDLRYNGGGDDGVAFTILRHFIHDTVLVGSSSVVRMLDPYLQAIGRLVTPADTAGNPQKRNAWLLYNGYAVYDNPGTFRSGIERNIKRLSAPVAILTGMNTESAAEDFVIGAYNQKHIVRIGERTNGSTGMPYKFDLPGGGYARICVKKDTYPDGREFVGYGIQPDIPATPTVADYLSNKDAVLEKALEYLKNKQRPVKVN